MSDNGFTWKWQGAWYYTLDLEGAAVTFAKEAFGKFDINYIMEIGSENGSARLVYEADSGLRITPDARDIFMEHKAAIESARNFNPKLQDLLNDILESVEQYEAQPDRTEDFPKGDFRTALF